MIESEKGLLRDRKFDHASAWTKKNTKFAAGSTVQLHLEKFKIKSRLLRANLVNGWGQMNPIIK